MSHGMRIVARSQTAKCGALGARRRAERARPLPSLPYSRNIGTACGLPHWVDGGTLGRTDGPTVLRCLHRPFDRGDRVADRPLHILLASNSASNLTDMILYLFWYQGGRTMDVPSSLIHSGERKLELILRSVVASPLSPSFSP